MLPVMISIPHCSGLVPDRILAEMLKTGEPKEALLRRIFAEGDPFTDLLFDLPDAEVCVKAPASRFVADLNRRRDEEGPNGIIKRTDFQLRPFYPEAYALTPEDREKRLRDYYDPFHRALEMAARSGAARFHIDGHSMTGRGPSLGPDQGKPRPALCIGNFGDSEGNPLGGPTSCPPETARFIRDFLASDLAPLLAEPGVPQGVLLNNPFDGGHILARYSQPPFSIPGVMIEVNRDVYLDEESQTPLPGRVEALRGTMGRLAGALASH